MWVCRESTGKKKKACLIDSNENFYDIIGYTYGSQEWSRKGY